MIAAQGHIFRKQEYLKVTYSNEDAIPCASYTKDREHSDRTNSALQEEIKISTKVLLYLLI